MENVKKIFLAMIVASVLSFGSAFAANKVNINTATVEQLQTLKGIGEKKAKAIVDYRKAHGKFKKVDDLTQVKGIGEKKLQKLSKDITVK